MKLSLIPLPLARPGNPNRWEGENRSMSKEAYASSHIAPQAPVTAALLHLPCSSQPDPHPVQSVHRNASSLIKWTYEDVHKGGEIVFNIYITGNFLYSLIHPSFQTAENSFLTQAERARQAQKGFYSCFPQTTPGQRQALAAAQGFCMPVIFFLIRKAAGKIRNKGTNTVTQSTPDSRPNTNTWLSKLTVSNSQKIRTNHGSDHTSNQIYFNHFNWSPKLANSSLYNMNFQFPERRGKKITATEQLDGLITAAWALILDKASSFCKLLQAKQHLQVKS